MNTEVAIDARHRGVSSVLNTAPGSYMCAMGNVEGHARKLGESLCWVRTRTSTRTRRRSRRRVKMGRTRRGRGGRAG